MSHVVLRLSGGNTAKSVEYVGRDREVTIDTGNNGFGPYTLRIHDGRKPGGYEVATLSGSDFDFGFLPEPSELYFGVCDIDAIGSDDIDVVACDLGTIHQAINSEDNELYKCSSIVAILNYDEHNPYDEDPDLIYDMSSGLYGVDSPIRRFGTISDWAS